MKTLFLRYDSVRLISVRQHETMLVAIHNFYMEEIKKGRMFVSSELDNRSELNIIKIELSNQMNENIVADFLEAMNTAAYYALQPDQCGEFFEAAAKEVK